MVTEIESHPAIIDRMQPCFFLFFRAELAASGRNTPIISQRTGMFRTLVLIEKTNKIHQNISDNSRTHQEAEHIFFIFFCG